MSRVLLVLLAAFACHAGAFQPDLDKLTEEDLPKFDEWRRFGSAEPSPRTEGVIRVATYNLENLFDGEDDPTLSGRQEDIDDEKPRHELIALARTIKRIDADVLCVEEVESLAALTAFRDTYLAGLGYEHIVSIDAGDERGIEQAVLSRFPLSEGENWPQKPLGGKHPAKYGNQENWYAGEPIVFHRSPLMVDVTVPAGARGNDDAYTLTVVVVHHKSGRYSGYWREAEAKGLAEILKAARKANPERNVLVLGDFNATTGTPEVKTLLRAGFTDLADEAGLSGDAAVSHESGRRIDLILANEAAMGEILPETLFVLGTPARPDGIDWRDMPTFEGYASDHYPVVVDLRPVEGSNADDE